MGIFFHILSSSVEMSMGENIKRLRKNKGYTQEQLAEMVGIRQCTLSQIERDTKPISLSLSYEITKVLEYSLYDFLGVPDKQ